MDYMAERFNPRRQARTNGSLILLLVLAFSPVSQAEPDANWFSARDAWVHFGYSVQRIDDDGYADRHLQVGNLDASHGWNLGLALELNPAHRLGLLVQIDRPVITQGDDTQFQIDSQSLQLYWQQNVSLGNRFMLYFRESVGLARVKQTLGRQGQTLSDSEKLWLPSLATGVETHFSAGWHPMSLFLQASYSRYALSGEQIQTRDFDLDLYALTVGVSWFL